MSLNYSQILERLFAVNEFKGMKLGLKNCQNIDHILGNPSQTFPTVHVAGTNGKGSVSTKIAAAYQAAGYKVGLYTSPHLSCFRERIRINGHMISEKAVEKYMNGLYALCDENNIKATFFELTTMMAFLHFSEEKVDFAVLETGLGGRLDATNIARTILSVITSISLEHTEILGNTIEEISREKAGIIKPAVPVVIGPRVPLEVIHPIAKELNSPLIQVEGDFSDYHEENCAIAKQALKILFIPETAIAFGLKILPPCRMEIFTENDLIKAGFSKPLPQAVILDVAHNPDGMNHLVKAVRKQYDDTPLHFVIGLSSNKDIAGCLNTIKHEAAAFHLVEATCERAASTEILSETLSKSGVEQDRILCEPSISSAVQNALKQTEGVVVICGTFFIMDEARKSLGTN